MTNNVNLCVLKFVVNNDPDLNGQNYLFLAIKARDQVIELFLVIKSVMLVFISTEMFFFCFLPVHESSSSCKSMKPLTTENCIN